MTTVESHPYMGDKLTELCSYLGCNRNNGESDWSLRKRAFLEVFGSNQTLAIQILFGTHTHPENFTGADQMMFLCLRAKKDIFDHSFTTEELQEYINGFNIDPFENRKGEMEKWIEYPGKDPLMVLKAKESLPEQGIIFVLEPYTYNKEFKNTTVGEVLFYDEKLEFLWEHLGGHVEVHPSGKARNINFIIQNSKDPDSKTEPCKRSGGGYVGISFNYLDSTNLSNDNQLLIQKKADHPGYNYGLSNWSRSFSRVFEKGEVEGLKFTIINALHDQIGITEADAKVAAEKIIAKFI